MIVTHIRSLLGITAISAAAVAFGWIGGAVIFLGLSAALFIYLAHPRMHAAIVAGCIALLLAYILALVLPTVSFSRDWSRRAVCLSRLRSIGRALHDYHTAHGSLPPVYVRDETGAPMHSWRVLILPYLEEDELYSRYNFNEPWDSAANRELASLRPDIYACPSDTAAQSSANTSYVAVVGRETVWRDSGGMKLDAVRDRLDETILLVEVADSGINWLEPRDLSFDSAVVGINRSSRLSISSRHDVSTGAIYRETGASVGFCDLSIGFLSDDMSSDVLSALLTANGGETIDVGVQDARRLDWSKCLSIIIGTLCALLAIVPWPRCQGQLKGAGPILTHRVSRC